MTIQAAIRQAIQDCAWHVTPTGSVNATLRYVGRDGKPEIREVLLTGPDKDAELTSYWLEHHDDDGAAIDSLLFVSTPSPFTFHPAE